MKIRFENKKNETSNIWTFYFRSEKRVDYIAGQFVELKLLLPQDSQDIPKRWFTLSSSPTDSLLSITTRINNHPSDYKRVLFGLDTDSEAHMSEAMGDFVLPKDKEIPLVFVAGGIGITPFRSIMQWLHDTNETRNISLIHAISSPDDNVFSDLFRSQPISYTTATTNTDNPKNIKILDIDIILGQVKDPGTLIYLSGPEAMVENLRDQLIAKAYPETQIRGDYFPGYRKI